MNITVLRNMVTQRTTHHLTSGDIHSVDGKNVLFIRKVILTPKLVFIISQESNSQWELLWHRWLRSVSYVYGLKRTAIDETSKLMSGEIKTSLPTVLPSDHNCTCRKKKNLWFTLQRLFHVWPLLLQITLGFVWGKSVQYTCDLHMRQVTVLSHPYRCS